MSAPSTHLSMLMAMQDSATEEEAWQRFADRYRHLIVEWCQRRGVPTRRAEDLTQEILIKIFRFLPSYDPEKGKFRTWLGTIIRNQVIESFRRERVVEGEPAGGDLQIALMQNLQNPQTVDELAEAVHSYVDPQLAAAMGSARDRVDPRTWSVFEQTVLHGRTVADVANELGISKGATHMAKRRVIDFVKAAYREIFPPQASESGSKS